MSTTQPIHYRGVRTCLLVAVVEGKGTEESPAKIVEYVLARTNDATYKTYGKVVELEPQERAYIGSQIL